MKQNIIVLILCTWSSLIYAHDIQNYVFVGGDRANVTAKYINNPHIQGVQVLYGWERLEPKRGQYDFSMIEKDLAFVKAHRKELFIQIQDRSFTLKIIHVPTYIRAPYYRGGVEKQIDRIAGKIVGAGWVAKQWNPRVRKRFQALLKALAKQFDGRIKGINLPETAIDIARKKTTKSFCNTYFHATLENLVFLKKHLHKSYAVQYVNFFPCEWNNDHHYMSRLFHTAMNHSIGLGNPDSVPYRKAQMKNSYPYFHKYKNKLALIAIAFQSPDYTYINPKTHKYFTLKEVYDFDKNYIGAHIIFWTQEHLTSRVLPFLNRTHIQ